jgi:hypothetical protein
MLLGQQRGGAGHLRRGHRGSAEPGVQRGHRFAERGAGGPGGDDVNARRDQLGLDRRVAGPRPAAGEGRETVVAVDRADGERRVRRTGRTDRAGPGPGVAGARDDQHAVLRAQRVHRQTERILPGARGVGAQAHIHDAGALSGRPLQAGDDARELAGAVVTEHLAGQQRGAEGDAAPGSPGGRAGPGDERPHVSAVSVVVGRVRTGREIRRGDHPSGQVRVRGVDAGVQDGDPDPGAGQPQRPRVRCADLGQVAIEPWGRRRGAGANPGIEPQVAPGRQ